MSDADCCSSRLTVPGGSDGKDPLRIRRQGEAHTVAMETDIYERLAEMAGAQRRPISSQMKTLIEDGVLRWEKEKRREEAKTH